MRAKQAGAQREGSEEPRVGGHSPRRTRPVAAAPCTLTPQSTAACLVLPSTHPLTPLQPNFVPRHTGHPTFPHRARPSTCPSPEATLHPTLSHLRTVSTSPQSRPCHPLPHSHSLPDLTLTQTSSLTLTHQQAPCPAYLHHCLSSGPASSFSGGNAPFHACRSQTWLAVAPTFFWVARALCWSEEAKPGPGFADNPWKALHAARWKFRCLPRQRAEEPWRFQATFGLQKVGRKGGTPVSRVRPREVRQSSSRASPPGGPSEFCTLEGYGS